MEFCADSIFFISLLEPVDKWLTLINTYLTQTDQFKIFKQVTMESGLWPDALIEFASYGRASAEGKSSLSRSARMALTAMPEPKLKQYAS